MDELAKIKEEQKKQEELRLREGIQPGKIYFDKKGEDIIRIISFHEEDFRGNPYTLYEIEELVDYSTDKWESRRMRFEDLKSYYRIDNPIENLQSLYCMGESVRLNGKVPEYKAIDDFEKNTELVAMNSKENLLAMKDSIELIKAKKEQLELMLNYQLCEIKHKFAIMRNELRSQLVVMQKQIEKIMRVIRVIELYLGIKEDLFQLQSGPEADPSEPLTLRQKILYMDEEVGILEDQGLDFTQIEKFDEWLLQDNHYDILLPEKRSIVVFQPRRRFKKTINYYGNVSDDMEYRDKKPYFLIRNGENIYRIFTDKMTIPDRLFPKRKEFQEIIEKMNIEGGELSEHDKDKVEDFTYFYQRIVFFIQGLIDRTDIFGSDFKKVNLMKMEDCQDSLNLIYDDELCLPSNRLPFKEWKEELDKNITVGSRIVWVPLIDVPWSELRKDRNWRYLRRYNEWNIPDYPNEGVYTVEEAKTTQGYWEKGKFIQKERKILCFRYNPGGGFYNWNGYFERKNNISFIIKPNEGSGEPQILNYDGISLDDVEFYLHSRIDRPNYLSYLPILKTLKKHLLIEQEQEDNFCLMLIGRCQEKGLIPKDGLTYEDIILELINWWKYKNKWKRPISSNDELAMKMIERRLFATSNKRKWFK